MANIKLFEFTGSELVLNTPELLLIPEFKNIMDLGEEVAWKYFTFLFLAYDNASPYGELTEEDRLQTAYDDSGLTEDQVTHGVMQAAAQKYISLQVTRVVRMLQAAQNTVEKITEHLNTLNLDDRTNSGGLVHKTSDIIRQLKELADVHEGITKLEYQVRQEKELSKGNRGDNEEGFNN